MSVILQSEALPSVSLMNAILPSVILPSHPAENHSNIVILMSESPSIDCLFVECCFPECRGASLKLPLFVPKTGKFSSAIKSLNTKSFLVTFS